MNKKGSNTDFLPYNRVFAYGWGTWRDRWQDIDLSHTPDGYNPYQYFYKIPATVQTKKTIINQFFIERNKQSDWVITMTLISLSKGYVHIIPRFSFVKNIGFDHPDSKNMKQAEPSWLNARWKPTIYPNTLSGDTEVMSPLEAPLEGKILAEHLENCRGIWLSFAALMYFLTKYNDIYSRKAFLQLYLRGLREKIVRKTQEHTRSLGRKFRA